MTGLVCYGVIPRAFSAAPHTAFISRDNGRPELVTTSTDGVVQVL